MSSPANPPPQMPLNDRSNDLKIPIVVLIIFSSVFVTLRLGISWKNMKYFQLTDHFLWTGHVSCLAIEMQEPLVFCS